MAQETDRGWGCGPVMFVLAPLLVCIVIPLAWEHIAYSDSAPGSKRHITGQTFVFDLSKDTLTLARANRLGDVYAAREIEQAGTAVWVSEKTKVLVLEAELEPFWTVLREQSTVDKNRRLAFTRRRVRILTGPHEGASGWLNATHVSTSPPVIPTNVSPNESEMRNDALEEQRYKYLKLSLDMAKGVDDSIRSRAWDTFFGPADDAEAFRQAIKALPLDLVTQRTLYYLRFPEAYASAPADKRQLTLPEIEAWLSRDGTGGKKPETTTAPGQRR